jgi:Response regulator containing CheY-like receiver, AAA-type ATPase, and DNA-binding domains
MVDRSAFNEIIKDALGNLYDTAAIETQPILFTAIQPPAGFTGNKGEYVRQLILDAIEQLRPLRKEESISSPEWRPYYILYKRYVDGMGIQELSDMLAISPRQMRRDHHRALLALTEVLWAWCHPNEPSQAKTDEAESSQTVEVHNEVIDAIETTEGVYKMLKHRFDEKGIQVDIEPTDRLTLVITDRVILRQALIGLFNESLHIQRGNTLSIKFKNIDHQVVIELSAQVSSNWEPADDEEIDDDLNAVRYWCTMIHAQLEEKITHKRDDHTIQWFIRLPHSDQRILLVIDDQAAVLSLFKRYLSQTSILPVGVENPAQALELARHLQPALITLDVMMPQMDGWELLQLLKLDAQVCHIPVIVCSAWNDPDLSRSLGASAYLKKPITQKMLLEAIEQILPPEKS